ncbi:hypothetical protein FACS1894147_00070 [Spirochaetia bacterium]|nr:hypothetical protein FACS1894147_00070 [Spirochaetia bacterium]
MSNDFIPAPEGEFLDFASTFNAGVTARALLLGIPPELAADNTAKTAAYTAAYHRAEVPNAGKIDREDRREKRENLTHNIRKIKNAYIDGDPQGVVTPEIHLDFGLPVKDPNRTDVPDPSEVVPFTLEGGEYLQVIVSHSARPPRYNGAVARYKVGGVVPETHKELTSSRLLTRLRETFTFGDAELGQTLYIALCWQNEKGRLGPDSPIQSRVIA